MTLTHPDDYDLDAVRAEWIGKLISDSHGRYPVEYDPIRRHCHMTGDLNPAFLDPGVAQAGPHAGVVVPPSMLAIYFASGGAWPTPKTLDVDSDRPIFTLGVPTPGDRGINTGVEFEFLEPIRIGDQLRLELRIADVYKKPIKLDEHTIWITSETSVFNQHDHIVATWRNTTLIHRSPEQVKNDDARNANQPNSGEV